MTIEAARAQDGGKAYLGTHAKALGEGRGVPRRADWRLGSIEAALNTDPRVNKSKVGKHKQRKQDGETSDSSQGRAKSSILLPPLGTGVENLPWSGPPRKEGIQELAHQVPKTMQKKKKIRACRCHR